MQLLSLSHMQGNSFRSPKTGLHNPQQAQFAEPLDVVSFGSDSEKKDWTREKIVETLMEIFEEEGYDLNVEFFSVFERIKKEENGPTVNLKDAKETAKKEFLNTESEFDVDFYNEIRMESLDAAVIFSVIEGRFDTVFLDAENFANSDYQKYGSFRSMVNYLVEWCNKFEN